MTRLSSFGVSRRTLLSVVSLFPLDVTPVFSLSALPASDGATPPVARPVCVGAVAIVELHIPDLFPDLYIRSLLNFLRKLLGRIFPRKDEFFRQGTDRTKHNTMIKSRS